jgi:MFS transporter, AAHS family, benzoate transport protein
MRDPRSLNSKTPWVVVALGFSAIVFDGYDLIVFGSAVPQLLAHPEWNLDPTQVGTIGSMALVGMFFGAVGIGSLTNRIGSRRAFIGCLIWFSVMMLAVAVAPNPVALGGARFLAGLGFGGIAPVAIALVTEVAPAHRRGLFNAIMLSGFPIGGVLAAIAGITMLEPFGFRALFALGGLPLVTLVPVALIFLPESPRFHQDRQSIPSTKGLYQGRSAVALALLAVANVAGFLLVFGLNTWLPQLMREAGYPLRSAIGFLLVFNVGAVAGGLFGSALADRHGPRRIATSAFLVGVVSIGLLAVELPISALYVLIGIAGAASVGTQMVVFGYVAVHFPADHRPAALGVATGFGRLGSVAGPIVGGMLLSSGVSFGWNFAAFAAVALVGAVAAAAVPSLRPKQTSARAEATEAAVAS